MPHRIPGFLQTYNCSQFVIKLFKIMCNFLWLKHLTIMAYLPPTNGKGKKHNRSLIARLHRYEPQYQRDWDIFVQLINLAFDTLVSCQTWTALFSLELPGQLPGPITFDRPKDLLAYRNNVTAPAVLFIETPPLYCLNGTENFQLASRRATQV